MFRETLQTLVCLSVLVGTSSLHMVRDSYHRPLSDLNTMNDNMISDTNTMSESGVIVRATRKPISNDLTYYDLFPSSLSSSSSSSNSAADSTPAVAAAIDPSIALRTPSIVLAEESYRDSSRHHIAHSSNHLPSSFVAISNAPDDISTSFEPHSWLSNRIHSSDYQHQQQANQPQQMMKTDKFVAAHLQQQPHMRQQQELSQQYHHSLSQISQDTTKKQSTKKLTQTTAGKSPLNPKQQITSQQQQQLQKQEPQQQQHLNKRTSSTAHRDDDDDDVDDFGDFGNFNEYTDNNGHMDMLDENSNQPSIVPKGLPTKFMLRGMRGQRQYDVPQIECPPAMDGMERFACPTPDRQGRYRCIDDHVLCDGFIDCPDGEDEERQACMFYKTTKAHLDVLADALLRWARGR